MSANSPESVTARWRPWRSNNVQRRRQPCADDPQGNVNFTLEHMENGKGETMPVAPGDGYTVWVACAGRPAPAAALLMRNFTGQTTRNPHGN
ncbi:U32 family peptidase C-terminal domain-containing protein [Klebsiella pneumoniae subsp. pneumoniae]|nr:U32 family peptidase C-terminal domain-containing protein [Klebsiella pneumoniae subsp. pneumoniae]